MKCPNCNAETQEKICPFCGSEMPKPAPKKAGCPKCGSQNINFKRESMGSRSKSTSVKITKGVRTRSGGSTTSYRTVGLCQDCGYAWAVGGNNSGSAHKPWWFWLLMIYIWPICLSIWFWKTEKINVPKKTKGIIIGSFWGVLFLIILITGLVSDGNTASESVDNTTPVVNEIAVDDNIVDTSEVDSATQSTIDNTSEFNIQELPVMNGTGTERLGTYSMCYILSADCTEETLARWYKEVKDKGYNWNVIRYSDYAGDENLGVYGGNGIIEKNVHIAEDGSVSSTEGEIVYSYDNNSDTLINFDTYDDDISTEEESTVAYATDTVKIRKEPNIDCDVLGKVQPGNEVIVLGIEGDWTHVSVNGLEGYIKSEFLSEDAPAGQAVQQSPANESLADNNTNNGGGNPDAFSDYVPTGAPAGSKIIVNATNGMIHKASCSRLPDEDNRIYYDSIEQAYGNGFSETCGICKPH